jgi:hypothetical protein
MESLVESASLRLRINSRVLARLQRFAALARTKLPLAVDESTHRGYFGGEN